MKTKLLYLLLFICSYSYAQITNKNNVRAEFYFNNGTVLDDSSVSNNHFTQNGTALTEVNDRFNNPPTSAVSLNGDNLSQPDITFTGTSVFNISYSFWLKTSTNTNDAKTIIDHSSRTGVGFSNGDLGYYIFYRNGKINLSTRLLTTLPGFSPSQITLGHEHPAVIDDGNWHHVVVEFRAANTSVNTRIYIDRISDAKSYSLAQITSSPNTTYNVTVGNNRQSNLSTTNRYTDAIDDLFMYNRVFTSAEVVALATYNNYCVANSSSSILTASLITDTTAKIDIAGNSGDLFDVAYHKASEPFSNATIILGISSVANLSGLDSQTDYQVYVKKQCVNVTSWSDFITFQTTAPRVIVYVDESATGNNDGTTWVDAYTNLNDGLSNATAINDVWVAKGTYKPHATDRDASFIVNNNIYGGFSGTEVNLSDRNMSLIHTTNATLLSGDLLNDDDATVDFNDTTRDDNSKHVVEVGANNLEINGLIIQDGNADALSGDDRFGAGIFKPISIPNLTVKNCVIKNNIAFLGAGLSLSSSDHTTIIIDACIIKNNLANVGAGLDFHLSGTSKNMDITITNSLFTGNETDDDTVKSRLGSGAAAARLRAYFGGVTLNATIINNTFAYNNNLGATGNSATGNFPTIGISRNTGDFGNIKVVNNIFWGNIRVNGQTAPAIGKASNASVPLNSVSSTRIVSNNIEENSFSTFTSTPAATIALDPLFTSSTDFTLQTGSSAVDSGNNSFVSETLDLLGNQRVFNTTVDRGAYEYGSSSLGINDFDSENIDVNIYPNPVASFLNIGIDDELSELKIYSILGNEVLNSNNKTIDVSNLPSGMYFVKIRTELGATATKRFIKK